MLYTAVWRDIPEAARILIDAGADVNAEDSGGDPLLYAAVWPGHTAMVQILVDAGADVNAKDSGGTRCCIPQSGGVILGWRSSWLTPERM